jgi:hypothetical protein
MGKGPTRRQGSGQKTPKISKDLRRASREVHKDVNQNSAGPQSSKKGGKGYNRKEKHKTDHTVSEELTQIDETYRGVGFPMAELLSWRTDVSEARPCEEGEDPKIGKCNPNTTPDNQGWMQDDQNEIMLDDEYVPNDQLLNLIDSPSEYTAPLPPQWQRGGDRDYYERTMMGSVAAKLNWSTHKSETFDDTGEHGEHPAWGLKSIIDRGVKTHEKPKGAKRIEDAENSVTKRSIPGKSFKSYSMVGEFNW